MWSSTLVVAEVMYIYERECVLDFCVFIWKRAFLGVEEVVDCFIRN